MACVTGSLNVETGNVKVWSSSISVASIQDADGRLAIDLGVYGAPETFVIDAQGLEAGLPFATAAIWVGWAYLGVFVFGLLVYGWILFIA